LDELVGFNLHGKTVGLIGTGRIGMAVAKIHSMPAEKGDVHD
jgi:D-lactate dehydrogenase